MKVEVIGTGCKTCKQLYELTLRVVEGTDQEVEVEYVTEEAGVKRMMELGLMRSPVVAVDGRVVLVGYEPSVDKIRNLIFGKE